MQTMVLQHARHRQVENAQLKTEDNSSRTQQDHSNMSIAYDHAGRVDVTPEKGSALAVPQGARCKSSRTRVQRAIEQIL